jgi:hypothetical protein
VTFLVRPEPSSRLLLPRAFLFPSSPSAGAYLCGASFPPGCSSAKPHSQKTRNTEFCIYTSLRLSFIHVFGIKSLSALPCPSRASCTQHRPPANHFRSERIPGPHRLNVFKDGFLSGQSLFYPDPSLPRVFILFPSSAPLTDHLFRGFYQNKRSHFMGLGLSPVAFRWNSWSFNAIYFPYGK